MKANGGFLLVSPSPCLLVSIGGWPKIPDSIFLYTCYSDAMMTSAVQTTPQLNKIEQVESALAKLIADASRRGFYGEAGLTLSVQDGRIQHIRVAIERMIKAG